MVDDAMKNYKILAATNIDTLAEYVERALNDGWELQGDVFLTKPKGMVNQAILKITRTYPSDTDKRHPAAEAASARAEVMGGPLSDLDYLPPEKLPPFS